MQFGGTTLTALLLGQPPGWLLSYKSTTSYLLAWWLIFYSPYDIFWNFINLSFISYYFELIFSFFLSISSAHAITSWGMDKVFFNSFHIPKKDISESIMLALLTSVLSSNGGGIICNFLSLYSEKSFHMQTPTFLQNNSQGDRARANLTCSFLLGVIYYIIMNPVQYFPWESLTNNQQMLGKTFVCHCSIFLWLQSHLFPDDCNVIGKLTTFFLSLIGISTHLDDNIVVATGANGKVVETIEVNKTDKNNNNNNSNNNNNKKEKKNNSPNPNEKISNKKSKKNN